MVRRDLPHQVPPFSRVGVNRLVLCLCLTLAAGCGVTVKRAGLPYYFAHPILNERWEAGTLRAHAKKRAQSTVKKHKKKTSVRASRKKSRQAISGARATQASRPVEPQPLRGNDLTVMRREVVLSAQRLVGIRDSFTQDSFIRHILKVNNLGLGEVPEEGGVAWLFSMPGTFRRAIPNVFPGDILFLGDGEPQQCVVVEKVDREGQVTFIGLVSGQVQRGKLSLTRRDARRDEISGKVLNSFIGKGKLAGALLIGGYSLAGRGTVAQGKGVQR